MAQSLFQFGQIETTLPKAKELRPFVEKMITLARQGTLRSRQRLIAELGDRAVIDRDQQEAYDAMSDAQRKKVLFSRSGRRHRTGNVPAAYNKKKIPFVARSVVNKLIDEIAPKYENRPGGYTRIIRLAKRRIGDNSLLAILQLVDEDQQGDAGGRPKATSRRRAIAVNRIRRLEGKRSGKKARPETGKAKSSKPEVKDGSVDVKAPADLNTPAGDDVGTDKAE